MAYEDIVQAWIANNPPGSYPQANVVSLLTQIIGQHENETDPHPQYIRPQELIAGSFNRFALIQGTPSIEWTVFWPYSSVQGYPSVFVVDSSGKQIFPTIQFDNGTVRIVFSAPTMGTAYFIAESATTYEHSQATPANTWVIYYPPGMTEPPMVVPTNLTGEELQATVQYNADHVILSFGTLQAGYAYLKF